MKIKASGDEFGLGEGWRSQEYELPDKSWVTLDVEGNPQTTEWSYFWLDFGRASVRTACYRVYEKGKKSPAWQPLNPVVKVLEEAGEDHDPDNENPRESRLARVGKVGAAAKLPVGEYLFEVKIGRGKKAIELAAVEFTVKSAQPEQPGKKYSLTRPRCGASAVALLIRLARPAVTGLTLAARPYGFNAPGDHYPGYLKYHGKRLGVYRGIIMVTLLPYLAEKHQIVLTNSERDEVTLEITAARKAPQYIFTEAHRQEYLAKLRRKFSEQEMRDYFREYNGTDDPKAGKKMLHGIKALRQSLKTVDKNSVILLSVRDEGTKT